MGDQFENISGGIIATRGSTIALEGAIVAAHEAIIEHASTLNQKGQQDVAEALKEVESLIAKASDSELALERRVESLELLKQVADEVTKPTPNRTALKFWAGLFGNDQICPSNFNLRSEVVAHRQFIVDVSFEKASQKSATPI